MEEENNISENTSPKKNINEIKSSEEERNNENIVTSSSSSVNEKSEEKNENQINANVSPKCLNANQCKKANPQQQQQQQQKKNKNRRRKRSYRTRKNSGNFKYNPKGKRREVPTHRDQVLRHQLFFTDSQRLVPYNTNEFLMEDHYPKISPNFNYHPYNHDSFSSSDCGMSGSLDEDEFLTKEFRMDYENLRSERLHEMTKDQLIQEYLKLENQTEMSMKAKENEISALNNKIKGNISALVRRTGANLYHSFSYNPSIQI
jgi:hypothetical protein